MGVLGLALNNFSARNIFKPNLWQGYPSGDGQKLSVRVQTTGPQYTSGNFSFTEPWFGGKKPNSLSFSAFYSKQQYDYLSVNPQILFTPGVTAGIGKRLKWPDDYFVWFNSLTYQYYKFQNFTILGNGFNTGFANTLYWRSVLSRNSAGPNPIYPQGGSTFSLSFQATPPLSWFSNKDWTKVSDQDRYRYIEYHKTKLDIGNYVGLGAKKNFVFYSSANFGFIGSFTKAKGLTPFERFYVGGDGLQGYALDGRELIRLRGWEHYTDFMGSTGAILYDKFTFELRYPIVKSQAATIYGLGYLEGGNAWTSFSGFNPLDIKKSAGVGVRIFLPMFGLLGFDWGWGFDPKYAAPGTTNTSPAGSALLFYIGQPLY